LTEVRAPGLSLGHYTVTNMQIRSRTYLQVISTLRALRVLLSHDNDPTAKASPILLYIAVALTLLLVMIEVDLHSAELQSLGFRGGPFLVDPIFMSP
jgi:hypothetical protein